MSPRLGPVQSGPQAHQLGPHRADTNGVAHLLESAIGCLAPDRATGFKAVPGVVTTDVDGQVRHLDFGKARAQRLPIVNEGGDQLAVFFAVRRVGAEDVANRLALSGGQRRDAANECVKCEVCFRLCEHPESSPVAAPLIPPADNGFVPLDCVIEEDSESVGSRLISTPAFSHVLTVSCVIRHSFPPIVNAGKPAGFAAAKAADQSIDGLWRALPALGKLVDGVGTLTFRHDAHWRC